MRLDREFAALHVGPGLLVLPNAWDAGSAAVIEAAGAKAIATTSAAVSWSHGYPDEALPLDGLVATVAEIARTVRIPVSADIVAGYAADGAAVEASIARILDAGAVGVNIEDGTGAPEILADKIAHARSVAARKGVLLWINARTDVYLRELVPADQALDESVRRAALYREAGADSVFVPALKARAEIARMVEAVSLPLNILAWDGVPDAATLQELGVRRLSAGGWLGRAAYNRAFNDARAFLAEGRVGIFTSPEISVPPLNDLMRR
jgi:2-methylisocitrate lyase-like PEP mutase family enzyme